VSTAVTESYEDRLARLLLSLRTRAGNHDPEVSRFKDEVADFIEQQARIIVRQDREIDDAYGERPFYWLVALWRTYRSLRRIGGLSRTHCARIALGGA
jgi:hypothetical protein